MTCSNCGGQVQPGDAFCAHCGQPVGKTCPTCGAQVDDAMHFCMSCGTPLPPSSGGNDATKVAIGSASPAGLAGVPAPAPAPASASSADPAYAATVLPDEYVPPAPPAPGESSAGPYFRYGSAPAPMPAAPVAPQSSGGSGSPDPNHSKRTMWIIIGVVAAVLIIAIAFGLWRANSGDSQAADEPQHSSQSAAGSADDNDAESDGQDGQDDQDGQVKECAGTPDATVGGVKQSGTSLVVQLELTNSNCSAGQYEASDVRVTIKDDGDVVAAAVYDFAKQPIKFDGNYAKLSLAFDDLQYWRPADELDDDDLEVVWQTDEKGEGKAAANVGDALGGANIAQDDREKYALAALSEQLDDDKSDAFDFYSTYTTQLSSKKYDMDIDGKKWTYVDIYKQFLQLHAKHPNALLIWAADYPNYTKRGNPADYYVILSGESFSSADAASSWCTQNGYGAGDCIAVDLK